MAEPLTPSQALTLCSKAVVCDICDGSGIEVEMVWDGSENGHEYPNECHMCEGAGWLDIDGLPFSDEDLSVTQPGEL